MGAWRLNVDLASSAGSYQLVSPRLSNLGVLAVKKEFSYNGCDTGMDLTSRVFGMDAMMSAKLFQKQQWNLVVDGIVGPSTARALFRKRCAALESALGIPDCLVQRVKTLESANDPSAYGYSDPDDHGLVQINLRMHPTITIEMASDPTFALHYLATFLSTEYTSGTKDWDVVVAAWNVGVGGAASWQIAGKPVTGGTQTLPDLYSRATKYVSLVRSQAI